jgi:copper(I)-binding protein
MRRTSFVIATLLVLAGSASAADYMIGALQIAQPWSRATPKGATVASGYLTIRNRGTTSDRLVAATFALSRGAELHEMSSEGGVMKMRALKGGLELKPGASVELKPGAHHLMFTGLTRPLAQGDRVKGTLVFQQAGTVEIEYTVEAIGGAPAHKDAGHGH